MKPLDVIGIFQLYSHVSGSFQQVYVLLPWSVTLALHSVSTSPQLRSTGCAERIPHTCPSLPNLPKIAVWSVSSIPVSPNGYIHTLCCLSGLQTLWSPPLSFPSFPRPQILKLLMVNKAAHTHKDMLTITIPLKTTGISCVFVFVGIILYVVVSFKAMVLNDYFIDLLWYYLHICTIK